MPIILHIRVGCEIGAMEVGAVAVCTLGLVHATSRGHHDDCGCGWGYCCVKKQQH